MKRKRVILCFIGAKVRIIFFVLQEFRLKKHVYLEVKMIPTLGLTCSQRGTKAVPPWEHVFISFGFCFKFIVDVARCKGKQDIDSVRDYYD